MDFGAKTGAFRRQLSDAKDCKKSASSKVLNMGTNTPRVEAMEGPPAARPGAAKVRNPARTRTPPPQGGGYALATGRGQACGACRRRHRHTANAMQQPL